MLPYFLTFWPATVELIDSNGLFRLLEDIKTRGPEVSVLALTMLGKALCIQTLSSLLLGGLNSRQPCQVSLLGQVLAMLWS